MKQVLRVAWYRFRSTLGRRWGGYLAVVLLIGLVGGLAMVEPTRAALAPPILTGHEVNGVHEIALGPATLAELHKRIGGTVTVQVPGGPTLHLRIVGTATLPTIGTTLGVHQSMSTGWVLSTGAVPAAFLDSYGPFSGPNAIFIRLRPGANPAVARKSLDNIAQDIHRTFSTPQATATFGPGVYYGIDISLLTVQRPAEIVNYAAWARHRGFCPVGWRLERSSPSASPWWRRYADDDVN